MCIRDSRKVVQVVVGDGDRDVSWTDSADITDRLAGELGPVQTDESADATDRLNAGPLVLAESMDATDDLGAISGLVLDDSVAVADQLAGELGPVQTEDSAVVEDELDVGPLELIESAETYDAIERTDLSARAEDSMVLLDRLGQIIRFDREEPKASDTAEFGPLRIAEEMDAGDQINDLTAAIAEAFAALDEAEASLSSTVAAHLDITSELRTPSSSFRDSGSVSDERGDAIVSNARLWPNAVAQSTNYANPNNAIDLSEATGSRVSVTQSGGLLGGSSQSSNGTLVVVAPNLNVSPVPSISNVLIQAGWQTGSSGGLQSGNSVNIQLQYSLNEGGTWTTFATVTATDTTGNPSVDIGPVTYAQIQQLRFRATGPVVSGTTILVGGANQFFELRYFRAQFNMVQTL